MRDAISGLIGRYDQQGRYFDRMAIDRIESFLGESELRIRAVELINRDAAEIVREASQTLFLDEPELLLPGGNAYTTRRLAACLRDMDYFLRYASYALVAGDNAPRHCAQNSRVLVSAVRSECAGGAGGGAGAAFGGAVQKGSSEGACGRARRDYNR